MRFAPLSFLALTAWPGLDPRPPSPQGVIEVRFQRGLYVPEADLWLDPWDAQPWAFVSHAHADHFARHEKALCSTVTAALVRSRYGVAAEKLEPAVRDPRKLRNTGLPRISVTSG